MEVQRVLPAQAASASIARRFAEEALRAWRQDELVEVTTLLVSELVTNAVLHAGSDVDLRLASTATGVRVEVADHSAVLPTRRGYGPDATTGRGLSLVQMLATSWGVQARQPGKVVWFQVAQAHQPSEEELLAAFPELEDVPAEPAADAGRLAPPAVGPAPVEVRLRTLPIELYRATQQHNDALLRELTLLGLHTPGASPDEDASPLAVGALAARLPLNTPAIQADLQAAREAGERELDVRVEVAPEARGICAGLLLALDEADELSRRGVLLIAPALPEIRACRQWSLGEVIAQLDGEEPTAWSRPADTGVSRKLPVQIEPLAILDSLRDAIVVGDDENRVVYANTALERLLGWPPAELAGQRITAIVPAHLHEAHIVGYSRFLVTSEPRLIGRPVRVPARHRDGRDIPVELMLSTVRLGSGRRAFAASLRALTHREQRDRTLSAASALVATSDVVAILGASGQGANPREVVPLVLAAVAARLGCQVGLLWTPGPGGEQLKCSAGWDDGSESASAFREASRHWHFRRGVGVPGRVWESGEALGISDLVADANFARSALAVEHGFQGALMFPVLLGTHVTGVTEFFSREMLDVDPDVLLALATIGRLLAPTVTGAA